MNLRQYFAISIIPSLLLLTLSVSACSSTGTTTIDDGAASELHMDGYQSDILVDTDWVKDRLDDPSVQLVDLSPVRTFEDGHIPGAVHIWWEDTIEIHNPIYGMLTGQENRAELLQQAGIGANTTVVVYDDTGGRRAARFLWMLHAVGHDDVKLLNGGRQAWQAAGFELTEDEPDVETSREIEQALNYDVLVEIEELMTLLEDPDTAIIDNRTHEQQQETWFDRLRIGRIPGSVMIPRDEVIQDGTPPYLKSADELETIFQQHGISPEQTVVVYGLHGSEAAITYIALKAAGYADVRLYDGSWAQWGAGDEYPIDELDTQS